MNVFKGVYNEYALMLKRSAAGCILNVCFFAKYGGNLVC